MLSDHEKIELLNRNVDNYWRLISRSSVIELTEDEDVMLCQATAHLSRHEILNTVLRSSFKEAITMKKIMDITSQFQSRDQAFTWLVNEAEAPSNLESALFQFGFESVGKFKCQFMSLDQYQERLVLSSGDFRMVEDVHALEDWLIPQQATKRLDVDSAKEYLAIRQDCFRNHSDHYHYLVGYIDGEPVISCTLFVDEEVAGIFNGCAIPECRRQGIGTALLIFGLNLAKQKGCQYAIAEASRQAHTITEELGFETLLSFHELGYGLH